MKTKFISLLSVAALLFSCDFIGGNNSNNTPAEKVDPAVLAKSYDYDGCKVELTGYIVVSSVSTSIDNNKIDAYLREKPAENGKQIADLTLNYRGNNSIWIPSKYGIEDLKITDNEGVEHKYDQKVTIEGWINYTKMDWMDILKPFEPDPAESQSVNEARESSHNMRMEIEKKASAKRERETGDPNNYSFEITVKKITPVTTAE